MNIAVPVYNEGLEVFTRVGKAPFFAIFKNNKFEGLRVNHHASNHVHHEDGSHSHEKGTDSKEVNSKDEVEHHRKDLHNLKDIDLILVRAVGPNMKEALELMGIKVVKTRKKDGEKADELVRNYLESLNGEVLENSNKTSVDSLRVVYPTDENMGYLSKRGAHFGKAKFYTVVTLEDKKITDVEVLENPGHAGGACGSAVSNIMALNPDALVVSGIGASPAQGFAKAGLDVYYDSESPTVEKSIEKLLKNELKKISGQGTCSVH
jgi:predicted Fe-Mo cluster-binding NifX family protein